MCFPYTFHIIVLHLTHVLLSFFFFPKKPIVAVTVDGCERSHFGLICLAD